MSGKPVSRPLWAGILLSGLLAAGCVSTPNADDPPDPTPFLAARKPEAGSPIGAVREPFNDVYRTDPVALEEIRSGVSDKTILTVRRGFGPQIEYYAPNGGLYLWYSRDFSIRSGAWNIKNITQRSLLGKTYYYPAVCRTYDARTYNPTNYSNIALTECTKISDYKLDVREFAPGDPFRLAYGHLPYMLIDGRSVPTLDQLFSKAAPRP